jgi:protein involved in polysaccharide export with SLBB domain
MPQVPAITERIKANRTRGIAFVGFAALSLLATLFDAPALAHCQIPSESSPTQSGVQFATDQTGEPSSGAPTESESPGGLRSSLPAGGNQVSPAVLSSDQIIGILQDNPDLLAEFKSQLADRFQQQGAQIDVNDISDEMLFNQISASASLRATITTVLLARGFVNADDLQLARSNTMDDETGESTSAAQSSLFSAEDGTQTELGTGSRTGNGGSGIDRNSTVGRLPPAMRPDLARQTSGQSPRGQERANASTDAPAAIHEPTPFDLQSMHDLYTEIPGETARLQRFGSDVFVNRTLPSSTRGISGPETPLDAPLGPDYVLGAGDKLAIDLWGGVTQTIVRTVDRDGRIILPEAGALEVGGLTLGKAQSMIEDVLKQQYRNAQVAVTVSGVRAVRVYVVGDVQRPGGYDISSLATPLSALYTAGGPTAVGSLRTLRHYRGTQLIEEVDLYDFLLHGIRNGSARFESGDTLLVPPAGTQVAVSGAVKRQAIYELKSGVTTLAEVIDDAGGLTAAASLSHISIERIDANHERETVTLLIGDGQNPQADQAAIASFTVRDGDRIRVEPILPYSRRAVYLAGHVVRPGRQAFTDGMRLSDVLRSYQDMLPEPAAHAEIIRLVPPDLHAETIDFNVPDVLIGNANVDLKPFDTIRIFGRYQVDAPAVTIRGEVMRPGQYPMSNGMTAAQLVRLAGGFKRDALVERADLTSYAVENGDRIVQSLSTVQIGTAVTESDTNADVALKPGDILTIHQITNWADIGESVTISGQVRFPGSYGFKDGERLSSVLRRAGGFLATAYPMGAVLVRGQVRDLEQSSRDELIRQIETNSAAARLSPGLSGSSEAGGTLQLIKDQQDQVIAELKSHPPTGRMVIHISSDIDSWADTPADIELRRDDVLTVPKRPGFVLITGQVYNATALTFTPGKTADWYLDRAGGANATANRKEIFIIRANGSVVGRHSKSGFESGVLSTRLNPGDVVVVPQKIIGGSLFWRNLLTTGQLAASIAITAGIAATTL